MDFKSDFDGRLQHPFSCVISGPSNSGKTVIVRDLIENASKIISHKTNNIVLIYSCWQPLYDKLLKICDIKFIEEIPDSLSDDKLLPPDKNNLLIIDDLMNEVSSNSEVQNLFIKYVHHLSVSCFYII